MLFPLSFSLVPVIKEIDKDICWIYHLNSFFFSCADVRELKFPHTLKYAGMESLSFEIFEAECEQVINYIDFVENPQRMYV